MYNGTFSENKEKMFKTYSMELGGRTLSVDIGRVSAQANGAALMHYGDTTVLCTATASDKPRDGIDFFPLLIDQCVHYSQRITEMMLHLIIWL